MCLTTIRKSSSRYMNDFFDRVGVGLLGESTLSIVIVHAMKFMTTTNAATKIIKLGIRTA